MYENDPRYFPPPERGMGCVAKGCLTLLAVGVFVVVMLGGLGWLAARSFTPFLDQHPAAIRVVPATDAEYQAVQDKLAPFSRAGTLSLSADDINVLIARDPSFADLRGKIYLAFDKGQLTADASVPVNDSPENNQQQMYLNGHAGFDASYADGDFTVVLRRITPLGGGHTPAMVVWLFSHMDVSSYITTDLNDHFHDQLRRNSSQAAFFERVHTIIVKDSQIVLTASPASVAIPANSP